MTNENMALRAEIDRLNGVLKPLLTSTLAEELSAATKHGELLNKMLGEAEAGRDRLKAALEDIEQGDYERSGRNFYNTKTRTPSKHDTCDHGKCYWDECGNCCSSFARKALGDAS